MLEIVEENQEIFFGVPRGVDRGGNERHCP
jgi:hypothetical protein